MSRKCFLTLLLILPISAIADRYDDAQAAASEGRLLESTALFKTAIAEAATNPDLLRALWGLADVYRQQGKNNAALQTLNRVVELVRTGALRHRIPRDGRNDEDG